METNQTGGGISEFIKREIKKPAFRRALLVFFICSILGIAAGYIFDMLQLGSTVGIGFGLIWMGAAYFSQDEK